jgi:heme o synthase
MNQLAATPTDVPVAADAPVRMGLLGRVGAHLELAKARLSSLVLVTAGAGYVLASGTAPVAPWHLAATLLGTALAAFGANALNQWLEVPLDRRMNRTRGRPIPSGRLSANEALFAGVAEVALGSGLLLGVAGPLPAALALLVALLYVLAYTPLKTRGPSCTQVGAVCGALPPVIGWTAVTGNVDPGAWMLFGLLYVWQLPHFLAIDWVHRADYARGGFRMLSSVDPSGRANGRLAVVYSMALVPVTLLAPVVGLGGPLYLASALGLGLAFLGLSVLFAATRSERWAKRLFWASLVHLPLVLGLLALDPTGPIR